MVTPNHGIIFARALDKSDNEQSDQELNDIVHDMKRIKEMLDKDCIFFWRLFQDIFKETSINFTGLIVLPNISNRTSEKLVCRKCSDFVVFRRHVDSNKHFDEWCTRHLKPKKPLTSDMFVEVVTRLNGLYVLIETPQQNLDQKDIEHESDSEEEDDVLQQSPKKGELLAIEERVVRHVCKVLMTPQQYEIFTSNIRHRYTMNMLMNEIPTLNNMHYNSIKLIYIKV